ncbi:hypothetical protein [Paraburkholderia sp. GAS42]|uniref:hypothetical protein n=1 Tax=Paraburkholderia sp. GAS42 TaxID=3035135 RepID=UPI003D1BDFDF
MNPGGPDSRAAQPPRSDRLSGALGDSLWRRHTHTALNAGLRTGWSSDIGTSVYERHADFVAAAARRIAGGSAAGGPDDARPVVTGQRVHFDPSAPDFAAQPAQPLPRTHVVQRATVSPRETERDPGVPAGTAEPQRDPGGTDASFAFASSAASPDHSTSVAPASGASAHDNAASIQRAMNVPLEDVRDAKAARIAHIDSPGGGTPAPPVVTHAAAAPTIRAHEATPVARTWPAMASASSDARSPLARQIASHRRAVVQGVASAGAFSTRDSAPSQSDTHSGAPELTRRSIAGPKDTQHVAALITGAMITSDASNAGGPRPRWWPDALHSVAMRKPMSALPAAIDLGQSQRAGTKPAKTQDIAPAHTYAVSSHGVRQRAGLDATASPMPRPLATVIAHSPDYPAAAAASTTVTASATSRTTTPAQRLLSTHAQASHRAAAGAVVAQARSHGETAGSATQTRSGGARPFENTGAVSERAPDVPAVQAGTAVDSNAPATPDVAMHTDAGAGARSTGLPVTSRLAVHEPEIDRTIVRVTDANAHSVVRLLRSARIAGEVRGEAAASIGGGGHGAALDRDGRRNTERPDRPLDAAAASAPIIADTRIASSHPRDITRSESLDALSASAATAHESTDDLLPMPMPMPMQPAAAPTGERAAPVSDVTRAPGATLRARLAQPLATATNARHDLPSLSPAGDNTGATKPPPAGELTVTTATGTQAHVSAAPTPPQLSVLARAAIQESGETVTAPVRVDRPFEPDPLFNPQRHDPALTALPVTSAAPRPAAQYPGARMPELLRVFAPGALWAARAVVTAGAAQGQPAYYARHEGPLSQRVGLDAGMPGGGTATSTAIDRVAETYGVVPAAIQTAQAASPLPGPHAATPGAMSTAPHAQAGKDDVNELAERAWQIIQDKLLYERERRGYAPWP